MFGDVKPTTTNVIDKYLKWKGSDDDGFFAFYDKEAGGDVKYDFDSGIVIREQFQVQGFDAASNTRIQCNKVTSLQDEPMQIRIGGAVIYDALYNKEAIEKLGYKLHLCLTVLDDTGTVVELSIKGTGFGKYIELDNDNNNFKIKQVEPESGKAGAIKYKTPIFETGSQITAEETEAAKAIVATINTVPEAKEEVGEEIDITDVPF